MAKNSFIIYHDYQEALEDLTDEQVGKLFRALINYDRDRIEPKFTGILNVAFKFIKTDLDTNLEKYENICERNKQNGKLGGRPKNPKNPVGFSETQKSERFFEKTQKPKKADNDNVDDNDKENDKDKDVVVDNNNITTTLEYLKTNFYDNIIEDEELNPYIDKEVLAKRINESRFLKAMKVIKVSWLNKNYEKIIQGFYTDFVLKKEEPKFGTRQYTKNDLDNLFDNLDDIQV